MTEWGLLLVVAMIATTSILVPGLAIGAALRLRGLLLWGFAPAAGVAALSVSAFALGLGGVRWQLWSAGALVVLLVLLSLLVGGLLGARGPQAPAPAGQGMWLVTAVTVGAVLGVIRMATIIGHPGNISQTNDATFHLNVLRFIGETGSASSLDVLGALGASGFYPAAWHALASLLTSAGLDSVMVANAVSLAIAGPVWTLSIASFVWAASGARVVPTAISAALAPTLFAFPFYMLDFGVLYPYALSLAIVPGTLALLVARTRGTGESGRQGDRRAAWALTGFSTLVGLAAIGFAQPAGLLVWLIGATALAVCQVLSRGARRPEVPWWRTSAAVLIILVAALGIWLAVASVSSEQQWPPRHPAPRAALEMLLNSSAGPGPMIVVSVLAVIGFVVAIRTPPLRWLALFGAAVATLTLVAVSVQSPAVRSLLAAWYADWHRFLALMPLIVIPFAALGAAAVARRLGRRSSRRRPVVALVVVALALAEAGVWVAVDVRTDSHRYDVVAVDYLSDDERDLLEALPELVGPDERVLGNPSAGAAFGYALSGRDVVPRTWSMPTDADFEVLRLELVDLASEPAVCEAVRRMGIDYVLDFGESAQGPGKWDMPGLTGFAAVEGFEEVAADGDASLWRITGCD